MKYPLVTVLFFLCFLSKIFGQHQYVIHGIVLDDSTHVPVPYVSIGIKEGSFGTVTNDEGEFEIKLDNLPQELLFRHISYQSREINITNDSTVTVELTPAAVVLNSVVVDASLPYQYLKKAFNQAVEESNIEYQGNAFYRQITSNADVPVEILEAFYRTEISNQGIKKRALKQGRYAVKKDAFMRFRNFSYLTSVKSFYPEIRGMIFPTIANPETYFDMQMEGAFVRENTEYVKISFIPKAGLNKPALRGTIVLNRQNYHVINITGEVVSPPSPLINFSSPEYTAKNQVYSFVLNFSEKKNYQAPVLDNIRIGLTFDLYKDASYLGKTEILGTLLIYSLDDEKSHHLSKLDKKDSDLETIQKANYDPAFWKNNPVIKRTPREEELINSFNAENAFGSLLDDAGSK